MEVSAHLRQYARTIPGKQQLIINAFARALEVIPRVLSANSGLDPTDVLNKLRQLHHRKEGEKQSNLRMLSLYANNPLQPTKLLDVVLSGLVSVWVCARM